MATKKDHGRVKGKSYLHRMEKVLKIYNQYANSGLSTREILRRYIYPEVPISESTLYNYFNSEWKLEQARKAATEDQPSLFDGME